MSNKQITRQKIANIRFNNNDIRSIIAIDKIALEHSCTRANAITMIINRLNAVDQFFLNPVDFITKIH